MLVELYVETEKFSGRYERLDMFEDESVIVNIKLKDSGDIGKVFSTYTQSFTVPAKEQNSRRLNFFFNTDISGNGQKGRSINAKIYVNKQLFKVGYVVLTNNKFKFGNSSSINLTFYSGAASIKDVVGEDKLSSLISASPIMTWTDANVLTKLTTTGSEFVPLLSNVRVLTYGDAGADDIKYTNSTINGRNQIIKEELRPAFAFSSLVNAIISKYDLDVTAPLFTRPEYTKLSVYCNAKSQVPSPKQMNIDNFFGAYDAFPSPTPPYNWDIISNNATDEFTVSRTTNSVDSQIAYFTVLLTPTLILGGDKYSETTTGKLSKDASVKMTFVDTRPATAGQILAVTTTKVESTNLYALNTGFTIGQPSKYGVTVGNPLTFKILIECDQPLKWTDCAYWMLVFNGTVASLPQYYKINTDNTSNNMGIENLELFGLIPDMKIIDFLDSFFKTFNIRVREENSSNKLYWETPQDFVGIDKDYSRYGDVEELIVETQPAYKKYILSHNSPKYSSSVAYKDANVGNPNSPEFGQLVYTSNEVYATGEYTVKTKFNLIPLIKLNNMYYETAYGFTSDAGEVVSGKAKPSDTSDTVGVSYKPNTEDFTVFYNLGASTVYEQNPALLVGGATPYATLAYRNGTTVVPIGTANYFGLADNKTELTYTNSLGFKDLVSVLDPQYIMLKNLYSKNYSEVITTLNDPNKFYYNWKCQLPPTEINNFDMRNTIIIGNRRFKTEEAKLNLTTGEAQLKLVNKSGDVITGVPMWTLNSYVNPNIVFTRNYGTDTAMTVQTSTNGGVTWGNNTAGVTSPRNIGSYTTGTLIRLVSVSNGTISNTITV